MRANRPEPKTKRVASKSKSFGQIRIALLIELERAAEFIRATDRSDLRHSEQSLAMGNNWQASAIVNNHGLVVRANRTAVRQLLFNNPSKQWTCSFDVELSCLVGKSYRPLTSERRVLTNEAIEFTFPAIYPGDVHVDPTFNTALLKIEMLASKLQFKDRAIIERNFLSSDTTADVVLLMDDKQRLHISKAILGLHSPFFHTMFYSEIYAERGKSEIRLQDVNSSHLISLLQVIYPPQLKGITGNSCDYLLELSQRFQIDYVLGKCEEYVTKSSLYSWEEKLARADEFQLHVLLNTCLQQMQTIEEISAIEANTTLYAQLSPATKQALEERKWEIRRQ